MKVYQINELDIKDLFLDLVFLILYFIGISVAIIKKDSILIVGYIIIIIREYIDLMCIIIKPKNIKRRIKFLIWMKRLTSIIAIPLLLIGVLNALF